MKNISKYDNYSGENHTAEQKFKIIMPFIVLPFITILFSCDEPEKVSPAEKIVVINELMPHNATVVADQDGEYDDWFELYNTSPAPVDLSGFFVTDNRDNLTKWEIPSSTIIQGNGYLIFWADEDGTQAGLHLNFKLSALGEELLLVTPDLEIADEVAYGAQGEEMSYSRVPNGTGSFTWQAPTFDSMN
ncbi:MAG TPA: lamin tail domain-containing protein [Cyclobacteriaceae bacterium]|nr:lamin tail domain-containing protein [Cyclobacteriaceae bacterium]